MTGEDEEIQLKEDIDDDVEDLDINIEGREELEQIEEGDYMDDDLDIDLDAIAAIPDLDDDSGKDDNSEDDDSEDDDSEEDAEFDDLLDDMDFNLDDDEE